MIYAMLKSYFRNPEPKLLNYIDSQHFSRKDFKRGLKEAVYDFGN